MGLGDVKLLAMIAGFLGFWPAMLALFLESSQQLLTLSFSLYAAKREPHPNSLLAAF